jgi:MYXO-CTERM domain-containing protein
MQTDSGTMAIMTRTIRFFPIAVALAALLTASAPGTASAAPGFLCSGGTNDGLECDFDSDCDGGGACLAAQFICVGGERDTDNCDCPGSICVGETCSGGPLQGEPCGTANNCSGGTCQQTAKICNDGDLKGFACANTGQCGSGAQCISNGMFCWGGSFFKFGCIDSDDCDPEGDPGVCRGPAAAVPIELLCSAGANDGDLCEDDQGCPNGACIIGQTVCDGGETTDGFFCESDTDCDPQSPCTLSPKLCTAGDNKGFACVDTRNCTGGGQCVSTGLFCDGGDFEDFSCVDDAECNGDEDGDCVSPGPVTPGTAVPTRTPTSGGNSPTRTFTRRPNPTPTATRTGGNGPTAVPTATRTRNPGEPDPTSTGGPTATRTSRPITGLTPVVQKGGCAVDPAAGSSSALWLGLFAVAALLRTRRVS